MLSLFNSIQIFALNSEFGVVMDGLEFCSDEAFSLIYQLWASFLYFVAPLLTFSFVLSFFKQVTAYGRYLLSYFKDVYIFSELNEGSLALATDITKNKKAVIVFTDVFEQNEETSFEIVDKAKKLKAILFKRDITAVNFNRHSKNADISFFCIGVDETENINQALELIKSFHNRKKTALYAFSSRTEGFNSFI